jgi:hypothetical protein
VNNERFATGIRALIMPGMDLAAAQSRLSSNGFNCSPLGAAPAISCSRMRHSLLPYSCIERVNLVPGAIQGKVERVEIPQIVCAGL